MQLCSADSSAIAWEAFRIRRRSLYRKHGDPFPLPRLSSHGGGQGSLQQLTQRIDASFKALNDLASAPFHSAIEPDLPLTSTQKWIMEDVARRVQRHGDLPTEMDEQQVLADMTTRASLYSQGAANLVPCDLDKIKILKRELNLTPIEKLLPAESAAYVLNFEDLIEKDAAELADTAETTDPIEPYWDPSLRGDWLKRLELYRALYRVGLLTFRRRRKGRIAFFTVGKKDGKQRLICDARDANSKHKRPPRTQLSTPAGFIDLDLGAINGVDDPFCHHHPSMAAGDVGDCFYNFTIERMSSWFCTDDRLQVAELRQLGFSVQTVFDDACGLHVPVANDEMLWFSFKGVCMGWSWALFLANEVVSYQSRLGSGLPSEQFIRDKCPVPSAAEAPVVGVYVDNVNVIGKGALAVDSAMGAIADRFESLGIPFEVTDRAGSTKVETLGLEFDFSDGVVVRNKLSRAWKLWVATRGLLRRKRISGELMRVWLGHVNFFFQISRSCLSSLSACYRFSSTYLGKRGPVWPNVRHELRTVLGLLFLVEHSLTSRRSDVVHLGDSSTYGFAIMSTRATAEEINAELLVRERWRFLEGRALDEGPHLATHELEEGAGGHSAQPTLGLQTEYASSLRQKLEDTRQHSLRGKRKRLFGPPKSRPATMIEAVPHPPVNDRWHQSSRWRLIQAAPWKNTSEHINLKEGRVLLMGIRRWSRSVAHMGKLVFSLSDNLVTTMMFEKGRSNSRGLNTLCKRACAYVMACGFTWRIRHVRTQFNVADKPSRLFDPPAFLKPSPQHVPLGRHFSVHSFEQGSAVAVKNENLGRVPGLPQHLVQQLPHAELESTPSSTSTGFLELFSGTGNLTKSMRERNLLCYEDVDIGKGALFDLTRTSIQKVIIDMLVAMRFWYIHLGTPCTIWSRARHHIRNEKRARDRELVGVQLAIFSARLIRKALALGVKFSLENPWSSRLWSFKPIQDLIRDPRCFLVVFDSCVYGTGHKKPTAILTNIEQLHGLGRRCDGSHHHIPLRGSWRVYKAGRWVRENRTATAGAYSRQLTARWALLAASAAPPSATGTSANEVKEFVKQLEAAESKSELGEIWPKATTSLEAVTKQCAAAAIAEGIVFGQHSKEEASRIGGSDYRHNYPQPTQQGEETAYGSGR